MVRQYAVCIPMNVSISTHNSVPHARVDRVNMCLHTRLKLILKKHLKKNYTIR